MRLVPIFLVFLALPGCGEREATVCSVSAEQTVLLRQIAVTGETKTSFDQCIQAKRGEKYCRIIWLDADGLMRKCMSDRGFSFIEEGGRCGILSYDDAACYRPKWVLELQAFLDPKKPASP